MQTRTARLGFISALAVGALVTMSSLAVAAPLDNGAVAVERAVRGDEQTLLIVPPAPASAEYRLTLSIDWTSTTHPGTLPPNAHVSGPIVAAHASPGAMFQQGALASPGVESMAETGSVSTLLAELRANPDVTFSASDASVFGTADRTFTFTLDQNADLVSLTTMLAPSPDWFVGFADHDLFVDDAWVESVSFPLGNYDAGTDSGSGFQSPNADTQPQTAISGPVDAAFTDAVAENAFGSVLIERTG